MNHPTEQVELEWRSIRQTAVAAAREAGDVLAEGHVQIMEEKSAGNLVTQADLASEAMIVQAIRQRHPDHQILSEEGSATTALSAPNLWIIDPLDGTNNFAHGIPQFSVSIAFAHRGEIVVGVVYDPNRQEMFVADPEGVTLNQRPIRVSSRQNLSESIIVTGFYYDRGALMQRTLQSIEQLFLGGVRGVRRFGSAALDLCWVACGRLDGYFEYQLGTWDFAAGAAIVKAAGGVCSDRDGAPATLAARGVIASNGYIHSALLKTVGWRE